MQLDLKSQADFPKFAVYIRDDFPKLIEHDRIVAALKKHATMNISDIARTLAWGVGPKVVILKGSPSPPSLDKIQIADVTVAHYEANTDILITPQGRRIHQTGVLILHEIISNHGGDISGFNKDVYGEDVSKGMTFKTPPAAP